MADLILTLCNLESSIHISVWITCGYGIYKLEQTPSVFPPSHDTVCISQKYPLSALYLLFVNLFTLDCKLYEGRNRILSAFI